MARFALSRDELQELSARQRPGAIRRWLDAQRIPHLDGADGCPRVLRAVIEVRVRAPVAPALLDRPRYSLSLLNGFHRYCASIAAGFSSAQRNRASCAATRRPAARERPLRRSAHPGLGCPKAAGAGRQPPGLIDESRHSQARLQSIAARAWPVTVHMAVHRAYWL